ncbi:MAG: glycerol kinase GlpK [Ilumatobacteraceae bacterium]|jgi:glycerol kinase|nr:glycerol kinase GlpK [Ilumatobacteraceae bacterium]
MAGGEDSPRKSSGVVLAIDAGTTGVRTRAVFSDGRASISDYREFTQHYPQPGWVEHDAEEIWQAVRATMQTVCRHIDEPIAAIGITNQRETVVAIDRRSGAPLQRAIVWQDRRTAQRCDALTDHLPAVRATTGLVLDPYFSGSKVEWLLRNTEVADNPNLAFATIDAFLIHRLTGGGSFATDVTNASRTMLFDIRSLQWSAEMCDMFGVDRAMLPEVVPSSGRIGATVSDGHIPAGIPVSGVAGDQQAALFGQACFTPGSAKNTYGTGSFVLLNVGTTCPEPTTGMLTTVAWKLGAGPAVYALEGAIFVTGAAVQWLRDGLNIIDESREIGPLAETVPDAGGVVVVPAFAGLGSPWWDPYARGAIFGITRGTRRAHIARAVVESMVFQTRDVIDAMTRASGVPIRDLRVDGGAAVMNLMLQMQSDQLGVDVVRPTELETTAIGAAYLAGLAEGVWGSTDEIASRWELERRFSPRNADRDAAHAQWLRAVERSRDWISH